jgi:Fe-S oxidoreductase
LQRISAFYATTLISPYTDWGGKYMPLPKKAILGILTDNLLKRRSVLPLSSKTATQWARGLDIPRGGETVLYTGHMYQIMPYLGTMANRMKAMENSWITKFMNLGRFANRFINVSRFMAFPRKNEKQAYNNILRSIALLLKNAGVNYGYLYEDELYSGALIYDQAVDRALMDHARRVRKVFEDHGVRKAITVDPHTTNMLRHVYPEILEGFDLEVQSYLEVLADTDLEFRERSNGRVMIHDSCVYARYEDVIEQPRELLRKAGFSVRSPELSGTLTHCCGGPIESLFPSQAHMIASKRMEQLSNSGCPVAAMCPICLVNLKHAANDKEEVKDIAEFLLPALSRVSRNKDRVNA